MPKTPFALLLSMAWLTLAPILGQDAADGFAPLVVCIAEASPDPSEPGSVALVEQSAARRAGARALVLTGADLGAHARALDAARATQRIRGGAMHLLARGDEVTVARDLMRRAGHHFATFTALDVASDQGLDAVRAMPGRRVHVLADADEATLAAHLRSLWDAAGEDAAAAAVRAALDAFHDAATKADEATYFALLPDDAVFLGTDAGERWRGREFRDFALPYFQRETAWTYVSLRRDVTLSRDGRLAWFDELLDNESYGACRGSGVLEQREGGWVLRLYDLAMLVPNDAARDVVQRIRSGPPETTTILLVRHAEKAEVDPTEKDPPLSEAGRRRAHALADTTRDLQIAAAFATPYRRTQATLTPLCEARELTPAILPAGDVRGIVERVRSAHRGQTVVVCGHSNTIPAIVRGLGVTEAVELDETTYDRLFVVTLTAGGARLLSLRY